MSELRRLSILVNDPLRPAGPEIEGLLAAAAAALFAASCALFLFASSLK